MKYNPAFLSREELLRAFVVRRVDLDLIIETIKENSANSNQHILLIGPRGMGKTMLVLRTAAYVENDKELNSKWYPIVFSEESYEVSTAGEFWLRGVFHLGKQAKDENLLRLHEQLKEEKDEKRLYERALACLMDFADERDKRLLLIVENLNMVLDEQVGSDGSWDIRHTLLNEPRIMLLATAPTRFDEIENVGRAMFDLFKIHYLEPLDTTEAKNLWEFLTGRRVAENRIRPIQILTGGNPRLLAIISSFAAGASFGDLMKHLTSLIDEYTNYFKSNIESLPSLERKVFVTLANIWEPATAAQVARDARMVVNKASSLLKRLESRGTVKVVKSVGGKKSYQLTERLYNIYHLMRLSGRQSGRVRAVVDFMIIFYNYEEPLNSKEINSEFYRRIDEVKGKWEQAFSIAVDFLKHPTSGQKFPNDIISFFIDAAAAGYGKKGLEILKNSACAPYVEPLIAALQMLTGEEYNAPQEVVEVAKDVLKKIEDKGKKS